MTTITLKKLKIRANRSIQYLLGKSTEELTPVQSAACRIAGKIIRSKDSVLHAELGGGIASAYLDNFLVKISDCSVSISTKAASHHVWIPRSQSDSIRKSVLNTLDRRNQEAQKIFEDSTLKNLEDLYVGLNENTLH